MTHGTRIDLIRRRCGAWLIGLGVGLAVACAGSGKGAKSPQRCMENCEQECPGRAGGFAAQDKYFTCMERCEEKCGVTPVGDTDG